VLYSQELVRMTEEISMRAQVLSRRGFLQGSSAVAAGALLAPRGLLSAGLQSAPRAAAAQVTGATVNPSVYHLSDWAKGAKVFDSYVGMPLATTIQKIYLKESEYLTNPLPSHITSLARVGCEFIICFKPSKTTDETTKLAKCLQFLNQKGIVYRAVINQEWNCSTKFTPPEYRSYWRKYAPVVKNHGVAACCLVCASSTKGAFNKIEPGFPTSPLPDQYWIDYYAEAYRFKVRIDGLLDQADSLGVPAGIGEFGYAVSFPKTMTWAMWEKYVPYLAGLAPRMPLGCLYFGCRDENTVTSASDRKIPGIQQVIQGWTG
jgi:hypothetical protein